MGKKFKWMLLLFILVFVVSILGMGCEEKGVSYELTSQDQVILTQPSVCFITTYYWGYVLDPWDNVWSDAYYEAFVGTGFCVNPDTGHIITAGHMVEISEVDFKYDLIYAYLTETYGSQLDNWLDADWNRAYENIRVEGFEGGPYDREVYVQFNAASSGIPDNPADNETFIRAEVIDFSGWDQRDIALIRIQPQTGKALSGAIVGDSSMVEVQDNLTIIGYPWTSDIGQENVLNPTITNGSISGRLMLAGTEVLQVQGNARPGNSGGPVLNSNGQVVGILTMLTDETNNYLRPSNDIKEMLNRNGVTNKLGIVDEAFKQGLAMYRLKYYTEAINHFNNVLNLNQKHLLAQEYRSKAQEAVNKGEGVEFKEGTEVKIIEPGASSEE
jgi:V8-like Glu-specific endopeptidase